MKNLIVLTISALAMFLVSCGKESKNVPPVEPSVNTDSSVILGNTTNMHVEQFDILVELGGCTGNYDLDIDGDNTSDFRFSNFDIFCGSMGFGPCYGSLVKSLHSSAMLLCNRETDTLFWNNDSTFSTNNQITYIDISNRESCFRVKSSDHIKKIWQHNNIVPGRKNDSIFKSDQFIYSCDTLTLGSFSSMTLFQYNLGPDTIVRRSISSDDGCYKFFNDEEIYIGIQLFDRLGWIKIMIIDNYKIKIIETAIQNRP